METPSLSWTKSNFIWLYFWMFCFIHLILTISMILALKYVLFPGRASFLSSLFFLRMNFLGYPCFKNFSIWWLELAHIVLKQAFLLLFLKPLPMSWKKVQTSANLLEYKRPSEAELCHLSWDHPRPTGPQLTFPLIIAQEWVHHIMNKPGLDGKNCLDSL